MLGCQSEFRKTHLLFAAGALGAARVGAARIDIGPRAKIKDRTMTFAKESMSLLRASVGMSGYRFMNVDGDGDMDVKVIGSMKERFSRFPEPSRRRWGNSQC